MNINLVQVFGPQLLTGENITFGGVQFRETTVEFAPPLYTTQQFKFVSTELIYSVLWQDGGYLRFYAAHNSTVYSLQNSDHYVKSNIDSTKFTQFTVDVATIQIEQEGYLIVGENNVLQLQDNVLLLVANTSCLCLERNATVNMENSEVS